MNDKEQKPENPNHPGFRGKLKKWLWLFHPKTVKNYFAKDLRIKEASIIQLSLSIAIGAFFSVCPTWGYQAFLAGAVAAALKLNKVLAMATTALSIAPLVPVILFGSFQVGAFLLGESAPDISFKKFPGWKNMGIYSGQYILGSIVLAFLVAIATFGIMSVVLLIIRRIVRREDQKKSGDLQIQNPSSSDQ